MISLEKLGGQSARVVPRISDIMDLFYFLEKISSEEIMEKEAPSNIQNGVGILTKEDLNGRQDNPTISGETVGELDPEE